MQKQYSKLNRREKDSDREFIAYGPVYNEYDELEQEEEENENGQTV